MRIVYISDGKAGHRSQALGLFQAIQRQHHHADFQEISIEKLPLWHLFKAIWTSSLSVFQNAPDIIIGVGSHTHFRVWLLGKVFAKAKTIILMKPSLPLSWFNYVIVPEHDGIAASERVLVTKGALNPIVDEHRHQEKRILIALGGTSKRHQWNDDKVLNAIQHIVESHLDHQIIVTTSRRTPSYFLKILADQPFSKQLQIFPVEQTPQGWIFEQMQLAQAVWVTEDSVSMVYEALTAGCRVGVIMIDRLKQDRITKSVDELIQKKQIGIEIQVAQLPKSETFKEADRVATYLLKPYSGV